MLPIKLNNQSYNFPTEVAELTLGQFLALRCSTDILDEICALTGLGRQSVQNFRSQDDLKCCRLLLNNLGDKLAKGLAKAKMPKQTTIGGKIVTVPKNLKLQPVGAFIAAHNLITQTQKRQAQNAEEFDPTDLIPQLLANYFWLPYMGEDELYSDEKIENEAYMQQILNMPVTHALPIANFFFRRYPNW